MTAWREIEGSGVEIAYSAPDKVRDAIVALGRTEDIRLSPDNRRLAIAAINRDCIGIFDIDISVCGNGAGVALTGALELHSTRLKKPHGLDFIDDETLVVANRGGGVCIFRLPPRGADGGACDLSPVEEMGVGDAHGLATPGSVWALRSQAEILVCNNTGNSVTRHVLDRDNRYSVRESQVLLGKWFDIPDGVTVSPDGGWIAVSNHYTHNVLLYENNAALGADSDPIGILRGAHYPHGLRFSDDGRLLFLADAGSPYVLVYGRDDEGWHGVRNPVTRFRVMDDATFLRGRGNPQEGGPKGLEIDSGMRVLAVTCECQPLAFFDLRAVLGDAGLGSHKNVPRSIATDRDGAFIPSYCGRQAVSVAYELEVMDRRSRVIAEARSWAARSDANARRIQAWAEAVQARAVQAEERAAAAEASAIKARAKRDAIKRSLSWRVTKPLLRIASVLGRKAR